MKRTLYTVLVSLLAASSALAEGGTNAITINAFLQLDNDNLEYTETVSSFQADQLGDSMASGVQSIQTNAQELIVVPADVATNGFSFFRNVSTNSRDYVEIGPQVITPGDTNFVAFARLYGGEVGGPIPLAPTNALYAQAGTLRTNAVSGVNLKWVIIER